MTQEFRAGLDEALGNALNVRNRPNKRAKFAFECGRGRSRALLLRSGPTAIRARVAGRSFMVAAGSFATRRRDSVVVRPGVGLRRGQSFRGGLRSAATVQRAASPSVEPGANAPAGCSARLVHIAPPLWSTP
jgi:hypothetical protein